MFFTELYFQLHEYLTTLVSPYATMNYHIITVNLITSNKSV